MQHNDGFRTGFIGADLVLTGHLNFQEEVERFGTEVIAPRWARPRSHVPAHA